MDLYIVMLFIIITDILWVLIFAKHNSKTFTTITVFNTYSNNPVSRDLFYFHPAVEETKIQRGSGTCLKLQTRMWPSQDVKAAGPFSEPVRLALSRGTASGGSVTSRTPSIPPSFLFCFWHGILLHSYHSSRPLGLMGIQMSLRSGQIKWDFLGGRKYLLTCTWSNYSYSILNWKGP